MINGLRVRPRGARVVIHRDEAESVTAGGIFLPDGAKDKPQRGTVLAVGPGRKSELGALIPVEGVRAGDSVLYTKFAGDVFKHDGDEVILVEDRDIIAVIEPLDFNEDDEVIVVSIDQLAS